MYSFRGAYGEAMPPQYHVNAEWIDEVTQGVSVCLPKNNDPSNPYFIHQAGVYSRDSPYTDNNPFFSPNIAKHCSDKECLFGTWGQQAHLPTQHESDVLYFNSYRDCGDGIIEFTSVYHNANADIGNTDNKINYLNTPWGGVRTTTLRDVFLSEPSGSMEVHYPIPVWSASGTIVNFDVTGGFTTFAEETIIPDDIFNAHVYQMPSQNGVSLQVTVASTNQARKSTFHSDFYNLYCIRVPVVATFADTAGCQTKCNMWLTNSRTGERVNTPLVLHWSFNSNELYFCTDGSITATDFNNMFQAGDEIIPSYANTGKSMEENLAFTFIHGLQNSFDNRYAKNRMRVGRGGTVRRDYTVYTTNTFVNINPGDTYMSQQYFATGELSDMESVGAGWKGETYEDHFASGEMTGTDIHLYSNDASSFGAYIDGGDACLQGVSRCSGKSVPGAGLSPLFAMACGSSQYVGSDRYHFAPSRSSNTDPIRSYVCDGEDDDVRPSWKLLGFFAEGSCSFLDGASYDSLFCSTSVSGL